jgi:hypothetical protein
MAIFIPCNESISAEGVADLYLCKVFPRFGLPSKVISDRDPRFISKFMRELCRLIGATQNMSTAYHPRTDGQSERSNQWLGQYLRPWVNVQMDNWEEHLPIAEFAHNSWKNETTHYSPFKMLMGYEPRAEISNAPTPIPILELRRETWKRVRREAEKHIIQAQQRWAQSKKEGRTFKEGEYVWLEGRNLHLDVPSNKLAPKRHGPFPIKRVLSPITYQLTLPGTWKIHDVFHVDLLTPYIETEFHGPNYTRPPPDLVQGTEEYEVEAILDSRRHGRGRKVQYLVKWKGYPNSDNEWVDWKDMHADEALEEFKQRNPSSVTHKRTIRTAVLKVIPTPSITLQSHVLSCHHHHCSPAPPSDEFGKVLPRTPPSPTPPPTLLFSSRVETPASWPPSDDMGIETHTPVFIPSRSPSPGTVPWAPIAVLSRDPSPFWPGGPRPTPEKGVDTVPVASLGSRPGSPIPGTPEYNYDLTSPPSPRDPSPDPSASSSASSSSTPAVANGKCTKRCFDIAFTLHHHDHVPPPSDNEDFWSTATLIEEPALKNRRVWAYGMAQDKKIRWERLDRWEGWEDEDLELLRTDFSEALRGLTSSIQNRGRFT